MISRAVDKKPQKWMTQLTEEVSSTRADLTLAKIGRLSRLCIRRGSVGREGKKLMEEFRAREGTSAIVFSLSKVQKSIELKEFREQAVQERYSEKQLKIQEKAV